MESETIALAIRGYSERTIVFSERVRLPVENLAELMPQLAEKHALAMATGTLTMVEIEFLDEPDEQQRFFRFGTDPVGMVDPIEIKDDDSMERLIRQRWGK